MSQQLKRKVGLRQEILVNFVVLSLIALGSLAIMAAIFNSIIGSSITGASAEQQQEIAANLETQLAIIFISLWEIIVISLFAGLKLTDSVIRPIHRLTNIAVKLCTHDLKNVSFEEIDTDFDQDIEVQNTEIGSLTEAFKKLVKRVKEDIE